MYATFIRYPHADRWSHGGTGDDVEGVATRLALHADMYGSEPTTSGYIFDATKRVVIATFDGGIGPNGRPLSFCAECLKTYETEVVKSHTYRCFECDSKRACLLCNDTGTVRRFDSKTRRTNTEPCSCRASLSLKPTSVKFASKLEN